MAIELPESIDTFGAAVRFLRKQKNITLRSLATMVGVTAPFLSDVEHGRRSTNRIDALAKALDVDRKVFDNLDSRIPQDVREWIRDNPGLAALLQRLMLSGKSVAELRGILDNEDI